MTHGTGSGSTWFPRTHLQNPKKQKDLPDDPVEWVKITLLPNPDAESLMKEPEFSPTRLLAGMMCYCIQI